MIGCVCYKDASLPFSIIHSSIPSSVTFRANIILIVAVVVVTNDCVEGVNKR
jgi:hypothetical protein